MCYNVSHVGAGNPVGIYVFVPHEYQEMLRAKDVYKRQLLPSEAFESFSASSSDFDIASS